MFNFYREFLDLMPQPLLEVGTVKVVNGDQAIIELPGGGIIHARGQAAIDDKVWVRDGRIEGKAPTLTYVEAEG